MILTLETHVTCIILTTWCSWTYHVILTCDLVIWWLCYTIVTRPRHLMFIIYMSHHACTVSFKHDLSSRFFLLLLLLSVLDNTNHIVLIILIPYSCCYYIFHILFLLSLRVLLLPHSCSEIFVSDTETISCLKNLGNISHTIWTPCLYHQDIFLTLYAREFIWY